RRQIDDRLEILSGLRCACGVARVAKKNGLGFRRDRRSDSLRGNTESVRFEAWDRDRHTPSERDTRGIGNIGGLGIYDFVAGIQNRSDGKIERLGNAHSHEHFGWVIADAVLGREPLRDELTKLDQPGVRRVTCESPLYGVDRRLANSPWSDEVRLADAER